MASYVLNFQIQRDGYHLTTHCLTAHHSAGSFFDYPEILKMNISPNLGLTYASPLLHLMCQSLNCFATPVKITVKYM